MDVKIFPSKVTKREVQVPSSKSLAHRGIICAALAKGKSIIRGVDMSIDIQTTIDCVLKFGAKVEVVGKDIIVEGVETIDYNGEDVWCNESGSTLRFMIPIFSLSNKKVSFKGSSRLLQRPQEVYKQLFEEQGKSFTQDDEVIITNGAIKAGEIVIDGNISSQFISGLLFALPLLNGDSIIRINPPFASRSYVDLTIDMLRKFSVCIEWKDEFTLFIKGNQLYKCKEEVIEADYSQLAFYGGLGALQGPLTCVGVNKDSLQGDKVLIDILGNMGVEVFWHDNCITFDKGVLKASSIDLENCPDLGPMLFALAAFIPQETHFTNVCRLRMKESDRVDDMLKELDKLGIITKSNENEAWIIGRKFDSVTTFDGHNDHRIVMALAIIATCLKKPVIITGAQAVEKSYPSFFADLKELGIKVEVL